MDTYQITTDSGTATVQAKSVRDALARCAHVPDAVRTLKEFVEWLLAKNGSGMMTCGGVVLARVYCNGDVAI